MIYLIRHGLDDENYVGGHSDVELTSEGISQIEKASIFIKDNLKIDKIISSDVKRSIMSADIIAKKLDKDFYVESLSLREQDKGIITGKLKSKLTEEQQEWLDTKDVDFEYPGGESLRDLYNRVNLLLETDYFKDKDNNLIVTHRGFINMIYFIYCDIPLSMDKKKFKVEHASIHELDLDKKKIKRIY